MSVFRFPCEYGGRAAEFQLVPRSFTNVRVAALRERARTWRGGGIGAAEALSSTLSLADRPLEIRGVSGGVRPSVGVVRVGSG